MQRVSDAFIHEDIVYTSMDPRVWMSGFLHHV